MKKLNVNRMFRAFADETRLRILHLLSRRKELCVCDIVEILHLPQSKVSRHLAYLRRTGLAVDRKQGFWSHYSLARAEGGFHRKLIACLGGCFDEVPILQQDEKHLAKFSGGQCR